MGKVERPNILLKARAGNRLCSGDLTGLVRPCYTNLVFEKSEKEKALVARVLFLLMPNRTAWGPNQAKPH